MEPLSTHIFPVANAVRRQSSFIGRFKKLLFNDIDKPAYTREGYFQLISTELFLSIMRACCGIYMYSFVVSDKVVAMPNEVKILSFLFLRADKFL